MALGIKSIPGAGHTDSLKNALATYGPLVTTMDVYTDFDHYTSGVYSLPPGQTYRGGHAILLIGYNDPGQYFICMNSWDTWWGDGGYFNVAYSEINRCITENNTTKCVNFGEWTIAYGDPVPSSQETVSAPTSLSGTTSGSTNTSYSYSTGGSTSSSDHSVQYLFDWGDGTDSGWLGVGTTSASKSWSSPGTYSVKTQARCSAETTVLSSLSNSLDVTITCPTPGAPSSPSPSNGATGVSTSPTLSWSSSNASSYDVYFGTVLDPPLVTTTTSTTYAPSSLNNNTTYYWKVVAKNSCGDLTPGPVWSFTTVNGAGTPVTVIQPNGGETLPVGSPYTIGWRAPAQATKSKLAYSTNNGATWKSIASNVTGFSYNWQVPALKNSQKRCRVRVIGFDSKGVKVGEDRSDSTFAILGVKVTAPTVGVTLTSGSTDSITWERIGAIGPVADVKFYFSKNGGATWILVATVSGETSSYSWPVPSTNGVIKSSCKVKVVLRDSVRKILATDISDGTFTVQPAGSPPTLPGAR